MTNTLWIWNKIYDKKCMKINIYLKLQISRRLWMKWISLWGSWNSLGMISTPLSRTLFRCWGIPCYWIWNPLWRSSDRILIERLKTFVCKVPGWFMMRVGSMISGRNSRGWSPWKGRLGMVALDNNRTVFYI